MPPEPIAIFDWADVIAGAERVAFRVEEDDDPLALIAVHAW